jgi:PglZ domain
MITIIADAHAYHTEPPGALCASGPRDYVRARSAIRGALDQGRSLTVYVTDRLLLHWLDDLTDYEGIHWQRIAPEADYRRLFGADPAPPFTPDLLIALDIASMNAPPPGIEIDPAGWMLGEHLHALWASPQGSLAHLGQLLGWALKHADRLATYLHPLMQRRLTVWASHHPAYAALRAGSLATDATNLIRCSALHRYDTAWLREQGLAGLPVVAPALDGALWISALSDLAPSIERYWRERMVQSTPNVEFIQAAIECMSGWSGVELRAIERVLRHDASLLDRSLVHVLRRRFATLPEAAATLDELEALVPPARPALPQGEWSDEQWLQWATNDYMPYFTWTVRSHQPRDHQQACALAYEMWLAQRYPYWLTIVGSPLITSQFTLLRDLLNAQPNTVVVWLVVDGMTWWQGRMLREICQYQGLYPQRYEAGVALLPSLTDISKRALVTGMAITQPPRGSIVQAAREKLERAGVRGYVGYDAREILEALQSAEPPQCLIWFANMLDQLAHDRPDFADDSTVRGYLEGLGRNLVRMRTTCIERGQSFHVLIGSDHGSTLLPFGAPTRRLPPATREVVDVWEDAGDQYDTSSASARAVLVSDVHRLQIDQPDDWHHLAQLPYQLPQDYLVPRGYAAIGRRPSGWTHGGLTPEETIVPLMHLTPEPLVIQSLSITISGQVRSRQGGSLTILLVNPNPAPLDKMVIRIADLAPVSIEHIAAAGRYETTITLPARAIEGTELPLAWELEGSVLGVEHRQQGEARIAVRRLQTEDRFDDLFG